MTGQSSPAGTGVGVALPSNRIRLDGPALHHILTSLDATACRTVWVNDHLAAFPAGTDHYPYHPTGHIDWDPHTPQYEALTICAYAAAASRRLRIGTSVLVLPQRHPLHVAKTTATLADLTGGRFLLGVGAGWSHREMHALGWDPGTRGARLDEHLDILRAAWNGNGDLARLTLTHHQIPPDLILHPTPRPEHTPTVLIGGTSPAALARVRRRGAGWIATSSADDLSQASRTLATLRATSSRPLHTVAKIPLPTPDLRQALHLTDLASHHGWDEISFEFGRWDLDDACELLNACAARLTETSGD